MFSTICVKVPTILVLSVYHQSNNLIVINIKSKLGDNVQMLYYIL